MKGTLPMPYIVAIVLAVAVIAVIAYLFLSQSGGVQVTVHQKTCEARCYEWQEKKKGGIVTESWAEFDPSCVDIPCPEPSDDN